MLHFQKGVLPVVVVALLTILLPQLRADSFDMARVSVGANGASQFQSVDNQTNPGTAVAAAATVFGAYAGGWAQNGAVKAYASAQASDGGYASANVWNVESDVFAITISGPAGPAIPVSLNLFVNGASFVSVTEPHNCVPGACASAGINYHLEVARDGNGIVNAEYANPQTPGRMLAPATFTWNLTSLTFLVNPNSTISEISIRLDATAFVETFHPGDAALAWVDLGHTFQFAPNGPVFNLPEGYTANTADGRIVNNRFIEAGAPAEVPEPASLVLVGSAVIGWLSRRRKKQGW